MRAGPAHVLFALLLAYIAGFAVIRAMNSRQTVDQETLPLILGAALALSLAPRDSARLWQFLGMGLLCTAETVMLWQYGLAMQARVFHPAPLPAYWNWLLLMPIILPVLAGALSAAHVPLRGRAAPVLLAAAPLLVFTLLYIAVRVPALQYRRLRGAGGSASV
jgi:hypothetical protein